MFPDEWEFSGNVSSQYKQVGNVVPVSLAYDVAKEIYHSLQLLEKNEDAAMAVVIYLLGFNRGDVIKNVVYFYQIV